MDQPSPVFPFLPPWEAFSNAGWERELALETAASHPLFRENAKCIARRIDMDDALFALKGGAVAEIHLTWSGTAEPLGFPSFTQFDDLPGWAERSMQPAHHKYLKARNTGIS
jgi:hypothetical protein